MAWRVGWLLLGAGFSVVGLPGCNLLNCCRSPGRCDGGGPDKIVAVDQKQQLEELRHAFAPPVQPRALAKAGNLDALTATLPAEKPDIGGGPQPDEPRYGADASATSKSYPPSPGPTRREPLVEALQCILEDRPKEALVHLQAYDAETQKFYLGVLPAVTILAHKRIEDLTSQEVAVLNEQLQRLLATLRPRTELVIERMCFCESVKNFGMYQPLEEGHAFVAGDRPGRLGEVVRLYMELRNFASVPVAGGFETRLRSRIEIRDGDGKTISVIEGFKQEEKPPRTLSRLNDFCNTYWFLTPALPSGTYQLVLLVADESIPGPPRVAQRSIEFRVGPAR